MKSITLRSVLIMVALLVGSVFTAKTQDLNSAILFTKSEQYDKANELLNQLIQSEPSNSKNYFYLGENYLLEYFSDTISNTLTVAMNNARNAFQKGVDVGPNDPLSYVGLAKIASYLGDEQSANEQREKARSLLPPVPKNLKRISPPAPEYAYTLAKIAESYINLANDVDTSLALPIIREAIGIDSKNSDVYLIAGDIVILKNDASRAIYYYNLAQMADTESPTANMKIGYIYVKGRALQSAIPYFEEAIQLDENYAPAYRELGQLYLLAQRFEQAKEYFEKYLALTAGNIPAKIRYVNALFYAGDFEGVIQNVEEIFQLDRSRTYMNRIAGYSSLDKTPPDYDQALSYMETLFSSLDPDRLLPRDYQYMARILVRKNVGAAELANKAATLRAEIDRDRARAATVAAAERDALNAAIASKTAEADSLDAVIAGMNSNVDKAFDFYLKYADVLPDGSPGDRALPQEITSMYNSLRNYAGVAKTLSLSLGSLPESIDAYMQVGRAYYNGARYQSADSIFNMVIQSSPDYIPAHLWVARTYSRLDPDTKLGLAKPKFDNLIEVASKDPVANAAELAEGLTFLGFYYTSEEDYPQARAYYNRLAELAPDNNEYKIRAYNGLGLIEQRLVANEKTNEGRLAVISRSTEYFNRILALDPNNASARNQIAYLRSYDASVRKGINPNEIRGVVTDAATNAPIAFVSIRVKDTAAENLTNQRGEFRFEIPASSEVLVVSARDYRTIEIPITAARVYNLTLSK
ncbi:MAG: carboxypeptidase-like regulatory domain-containing protein [Bacteroidales bacterium]|jgi:tetratricopeptide (TPR) repeat protein|nr:carboxypeptidase-like regulatory domain-containing protein [Bacteroidales bacterium]